jgi:hypothetical protein
MGKNSALYQLMGVRMNEVMNRIVSCIFSFYIPIVTHSQKLIYPHIVSSKLI